MFKLIAFALTALAALSVVNGAPIFARRAPPAGWNADILEHYEDYHTRYLAIGCQNQHNTQFFDDCCHPLKKGETLQNNRKPYCSPEAVPSSLSGPSSSPAPEPTSVPSPNEDTEYNADGNDDDGDDECEDDPTPSVNEPSPTPLDPTPAPSPSPSPSPDVQSTPASDPTPTSTPSQNTPSETHTGGHITWFTQNGVAGACGQVHSDNDFVAALDTRVYGDTGVQSSYCGKKIRITAQGNSVDVIVADACPTCDNASSVDLSLAAFQALAPLSQGLLTDASWELL